MRLRILVIFLLAVSSLALISACDDADDDSAPSDSISSSVTNFDECVAQGNPVMESFPPQCITPDGITFTQEMDEEPPPVNEACEDQCGDGTCQEVVCLALGCPCAESEDSCPKDCT